jgi:cell division septation protein DedD
MQEVTMEDSRVADQTPAEVKEGLEALKAVQSSAAPPNNDPEAIDERLQKARANQREFIIRLYVTSAVVIALLSFAIYLTIKLS